jgi:hypothetical protein
MTEPCLISVVHHHTSADGLSRSAGAPAAATTTRRPFGHARERLPRLRPNGLGRRRQAGPLLSRSRILLQHGASVGAVRGCLALSSTHPPSRQPRLVKPGPEASTSRLRAPPRHTDQETPARYPPPPPPPPGKSATVRCAMETHSIQAFFQFHDISTAVHCVHAGGRGRPLVPVAVASFRGGSLLGIPKCSSACSR